MRVQVITKDNGLGLSNDVRILSSTLIAISGNRMEIVFTSVEARPDQFKPFDVNIFLELVNPAYFRQAARNILVPNPEWYFKHWEPHIRQFDQVWAKTRDTERIFGAKHKNVVYTGWSSMDRYNPTIQREPHAMLHVAGGSSAKGTEELLEAMESHPTRTLTLITKQPWNKRRPYPRNVRVLPPVDDKGLAHEMNRCGIHLCPSSYEGFGHYLNEARSVGALVITTNAPPMNELIGDFGILARPSGLNTPQNLAVHRHVDPTSLALMIGHAVNAPAEVITMLGQKARAAYLAELKAFEERLLNIFA